MPTRLVVAIRRDNRPRAARRRWSWLARVVPSLLLLQLGTGCAGLSRLPAEPASLTDHSTVLGIKNARFWPDTDAAAMIAEANRARERERAARAKAGQTGSEPPANFLAISGGSDNGAFAAGLLVGWSASGTRPSFKLVTGISTGALVAPFAFLGPAYDRQLRAVYTGIGPDNIYEKRGLLSAVFHESLADTTPLFQLISRYANADMLAAIAREYDKGRLLLIGTTDIDVQRPVFWNIGAIAASGRPGALDLFRKILLASAAVPGLFPPVMIDVEFGRSALPGNARRWRSGGANLPLSAADRQARQFAAGRSGPPAPCLYHPLRPARPGLGDGRSATVIDRRPRHLDDDPLQRLQRYFENLCDGET